MNTIHSRKSILPGHDPLDEFGRALAIIAVVVGVVVLGGVALLLL